MRYVTSLFQYQSRVYRYVLLILGWFLARRYNRLRHRLQTRELEPTDMPIIDETLVVKTNNGRIRGYVSSSPNNGMKLANFRGIPFAAPPVNELRFRHAVPAPSWDGRVLNCTRFGFRSISNPSYGLEYLILSRFSIVIRFLFRFLFGWGLNTNAMDPHPRNPQQSEDCLTLNISMPLHALESNYGKKLPVCVFIHGGAFVFGHASEALYALPWGSPLAEHDIIAVTVQYRLGLLGWVKVDGGDYNCGLSDQIRALEWVKEEIYNFCGDSNCVSIFGHSAGAMSVAAILASPRAKGLFCRAALMSGAGMNCITKKQAAKATGLLPKAFRIPVCNLETLRKFSPEACFAAQEYLVIMARLGPMPFQPVIDGDFLLEIPQDAIANKGVCDHLDLLVGTTQEEIKLFDNLNPIQPFNRWSAIQIVKQLVGPHITRFEIDHDNAKLLATQLVDSYAEKMWSSNLSSAENYREVFSAIATDLVFEAPASLLCEASVKSLTRQKGKKIWKYRFGIKGPKGSAHGIELPFLFGTYVLSKDQELMQGLLGLYAEDHNRFADMICTVWANFFINGNIHPAKGLEEWKEFTLKKRETMIIDWEKCILRKCREDDDVKKEIEQVLLSEEVLSVRDNHVGFDTLVRKRSTSGSAFGMFPSPSTINLPSMEAGGKG